MKTKSTLASGVKETMLDAPAPMVVLTAEDIAQRGYMGLDEIVADLPDFDIINSVGSGSDIHAYQRGYRTVETQRTLLMINGIVDNHLWSHIANLGKHFPVNNIKRVEVLYGPASAVYGANAFLGIINIVTKDEGKENNQNKNKVSLIGGSWQAGAVDASIEGNIGNFKYSIGAKLHRTETEDMSDRWGFLSNKWYGNRDVWGPLLDIKVRGENLGRFRSLSESHALVSRIEYKNFEIGSINWQTSRGYGYVFSGDKGQSNAGWKNASNQYYIRHLIDKGHINNNATLSYRESRLWGDWAEAAEDWNPGMSQYSYISYSLWNSMSSSMLFRDNLVIKLNNNIQLLTGIKYERKVLTKAYDVANYWNNSFTSVFFQDPDGSYDLGSGIGHSTDTAYVISAAPLKEMPSENEAITHDVGGHLLAVLDLGQFRFNAGVRYDRNSVYGQVVNPRISLIFKPSNSSAIKLIYGEAFQEPQPRALWGGWSGRKANEDLKPEKVKNFELNLIYRTGDFIHEIVSYYSEYFDVIKEEAENVGTRDVIGLGYKLNYSVPNFIDGAPSIKGYLYYNYTMVHNSLFYNHSTSAWENGRTFLGDIAPHKINIGFTLPLQRNLFLNIRSNIVSERTLYTRNPLRDKGRMLAAYHTMHTNLTYIYKIFRIGFRVNNIFNHHFLQPGVRSANGGDDFTQRSKGFYNSLIPAPGRSFLVNATVSF